ncbi:hypothetical protein LNY53_29590 [Klebsiella pneumoniae]|nr:hypothetical protein [Klebsiella pneumoniae]
MQHYDQTAALHRQKAPARVAFREADKKVKEAEANKDDFVTYNPPHEYGSGWQDCVQATLRVSVSNETVPAQASLNVMNESLSRDKAALTGRWRAGNKRRKRRRK